MSTSCISNILIVIATISCSSISANHLPGQWYRPPPNPLKPGRNCLSSGACLPAILHEEDQTQDDHEILTTEYADKKLNFVCGFLSIRHTTQI